MGDEFPNAQVEATDLSPIQPTNAPENVHFYIDDASEDDWALPASRYDYIHTRVMLGCFTDFREVIRKAFYHLKPGAYMESQEILPSPSCDDGTIPADWAFSRWMQLSDEAAMKADKPLLIANKLKGWYEECGFVDVNETVFKLPLNPWPKDKHLKNLGQMYEKNWLYGLHAFSAAPYSRMLNWSSSEIDVLQRPHSLSNLANTTNRRLLRTFKKTSQIDMSMHIMSCTLSQEGSLTILLQGHPRIEAYRRNLGHILRL